MQGSSGRRNHAVALASALLAVPLLIAHPAVATLLLSASFIGVAVLLERWPVAGTVAREVGRQSPAPALVRPRSPRACSRWELVERDGRRSLEMRWR